MHSPAMITVILIRKKARYVVVWFVFVVFFVLSKKGRNQDYDNLSISNKKKLLIFHFLKKFQKTEYLIKWIIVDMYRQIDQYYYHHRTYTHTTPVAWFFFFLALVGHIDHHHHDDDDGRGQSLFIVQYDKTERWLINDDHVLSFFLLNTVKKNTILFQRLEKEKMVHLITNLHYKFLLIIIIEREKNSPQFYIDFEGENKIIIVDNDNDGIIGNNFNWYSFLFIQTIKKNLLLFFVSKIVNKQTRNKRKVKNSCQSMVYLIVFMYDYDQKFWC